MNNKNIPWGSSLRSVFWNRNVTDRTDSEILISSTVSSWYDKKHNVRSEAELEFINSIPVSRCPHCGSEHFTRSGRTKNGLQKYRCKHCKTKFTPLTGTIFEDGKIPISEWIAYLLSLFEFHSITTASRDNRNAASTGKYWLIKVFTVLQECQKNVVLEGNVYIDELFFKVEPRKEETKDGKKLRGISRNKICVGVGVDDHQNMFMQVENTSKPSNRSTWQTFGSHIKAGSCLIHDGEHSHSVLVDKLNLSEEVYYTEDTRKLADKDNPLDPINNLHSLIKRFMREHGGFKRDDLQDWMNLIWFILSDPVNRYEKVGLFIDMAISSPHKVKYRATMCNKRDDYAD